MSQVGVFTIAGLVGMASSTRWTAPQTCAVAGPHRRRPLAGEQEHHLAAGVVQLQGARQPLQHLLGGRTAAALLEPGVPGDADGGARGHLLAPQARRAPAARRGGLGREARPAIAQELAQAWAPRRPGC